MRMAFATLVLVIYQGLFIDVIARSLYATGSKSIGIATRQPLLSTVSTYVHLDTPFSAPCIAILHPSERQSSKKHCQWADA